MQIHCCFSHYYCIRLARKFIWFFFHTIFSKPLSGFFQKIVHAASAKSLESCPTLCNPRDGSPPGSPVSGILQARTLEWVAISFSNA